MTDLPFGCVDHCRKNLRVGEVTPVADLRPGFVATLRGLHSVHLHSPVECSPNLGSILVAHRVVVGCHDAGHAHGSVNFSQGMFGARHVTEYPHRGRRALEHLGELERVGRPFGEKDALEPSGRLLGPYALLTTAEVLVSTTGLEFAYSQAPTSMKSTLMSFWLLTAAIGNLFVARASTLITFKGAPLFFFYACCAVGATLALGLIARKYVVVERYRPAAITAA